MASDEFVPQIVELKSVHRSATSTNTTAASIAASHRATTIQIETKAVAKWIQTTTKQATITAKATCRSIIVTRMSSDHEKC